MPFWPLQGRKGKTHENQKGANGLSEQTCAKNGRIRFCEGLLTIVCLPMSFVQPVNFLAKCKKNQNVRLVAEWFGKRLVLLGFFAMQHSGADLTGMEALAGEGAGRAAGSAEIPERGRCSCSRPVLGAGFRCQSCPEEDRFLCTPLPAFRDTARGSNKTACHGACPWAGRCHGEGAV